MRKLVLALVGIIVLSSPAVAGRNANGAMIVHTNDDYAYSALTVCTAEAGDPGTCENAVTTANRIAGQVIWLLAAFHATASPGVTVIYFGIDYDDVNLDPGIAYKFCGPSGSLEVPDTDWPYMGRGNSVAYGSPVVGDTLFPFYVFKIDNYGAGAGEFFCTTTNPTGGYAAFVDDSNPPLLDYCTRFGCVRWGEPGYNECPVIDLTGACCAADGSCLVLTRDECANAGGTYQGDGTMCDPNPCPVPGACCFEDGSCQFVLSDVCAQNGGEFIGGPCDPNQCPQPEGACCATDGTCSITVEAGCDGTWQGAGTVCEPNPCPQPEMGACCIQGECTITTQEGCAGEWKGAGTDCDPNPCEPTPTRVTTWGAIKGSYR